MQVAASCGYLWGKRDGCHRLPLRRAASSCLDKAATTTHCPASAASLTAWARSASRPRERSPMGVSTTTSEPEPSSFSRVFSISASRSNPAAPTGFRGSENVLVGESAAALPVPLSRRAAPASARDSWCSDGLRTIRRFRGLAAASCVGALPPEVRQLNNDTRVMP